MNYRLIVREWGKIGRTSFLNRKLLSYASLRAAVNVNVGTVSQLPRRWSSSVDSSASSEVEKINAVHVDSPSEGFHKIKELLKSKNQTNAIKILKNNASNLNMDEYRALIIDAGEMIDENKNNIALLLLNSKFISLAYTLMVKNFPDVKLTSQLFEIVIKSFSCLQRSDNVHEVFQRVMDQNMSFNYKDFEFTINQMARAKCLNKMFDWFHNEIENNGRNDVIMLNSYIYLCDKLVQTNIMEFVDIEKSSDSLALIDLEKLNQLLTTNESSMEKEKSRNIITRFTRLERLILIYGMKNDMDSAIQNLQELVKARKKHPSITGYRNLIEVAYHCGKPELIHNCLQEMKQFYPGKMNYLRYSLIKVINVLAEHPESNEDLKLAIQGVLDISFPSKGTRTEFVKRYYPQLLKTIEKCNGLDVLKTKLNEELSKIQSAEREKSTLNPRHFEFQLNKEMALENNINNVIGLYEKMLKSPNAHSMSVHVLSEKIVDYLFRHRSVEGIQKVMAIQSNYSKEEKPPSYLTCMKYLTLLLEKKKTSAALAFYQKMVGQYEFKIPAKFLMNPIITGFENSNAQPSVIDTILKNAETTDEVFKNGGELVNISRTANQAYNLLIQKYGRERNFSKAIEVFNRMISPSNKFNVSPNIATYNGILFALMRDWNLDDFEKLYLNLQRNLNNRKDEEGLDFQQKKKIMTEHFKETSCEVPYHLNPPKYVIPTRATENIRLSYYILGNKTEDAINAFKNSINYVQPDLITYELLAAVYLKAHSKNWSDKALQKHIASECSRLIGENQITQENVEDVLTTVENICAKKTQA